MLALTAGCSTGSLAIRYLYGRFDNTLNERILAYADFSATQEAEIRRAVDEYVAWHRQNELPRYAALLAEVTTQLESGDYDVDVVMASLEQVRAYSDHGYQMSPIVNAQDFLRDLSDEQVRQIAEKFRQREESFREWQAKRQREGDAGRLEAIVKNVARLGVRLTEEQRFIIADGIKRYRWRPGERRRLWRRWETDFLTLLNRRHETGFTASVTQHLAGYQKLGRMADPERDAWNQRNTARIIRDVLVTLDDQQRGALIRRLTDTRRTLLAMADD